MNYNLKRKISKLLAVVLVAGTISTSGLSVSIKSYAAPSVKAEEPTAHIEETTSYVVEPTTSVEVTTTYNEDPTSFNEETTSTEETSIDETTSDENPSETTVEESTSVEETTTDQVIGPVIPKPVKWNGKIVPGATMKGIDVSHHNGNINWKKVKNSDIDYAIIRCGYGSDKKSQDDSKWANNVAGCEKYKIPYGVYIYSYATSVAQAKSEAAHVLRMVKGHKLSFPIYYDMEDMTQERLSNSKKKKIAKTFMDIISSSGYEVSIYANLNWWNVYLNSFADTITNKWVAQYNTHCSYKKDYSMWQCTSTEKVPGIYGDTDLNFWYGDIRTADYDIYKEPSNKRPDRAVISKVKAGKKSATLIVKKTKKAVGYKIEYSTSKKFKKVKAAYSESKTVKIASLKGKKVYYFRVKAYKLYKGKKLYSKQWSKVKSVKTKK